MAIKGQSITVSYTAWDTANGAPKTGDVANHTIYIIKDGTAGAATNSPSEVDATNCPGEYKITLTAAEMTASTVVVCGESSTSDIQIIPVKIVTELGTLATLDTVADAIKAVTDNLPNSGALSSLAQETTLTAVKGGGWSASNDTLEHIRDAISNIPAQRQTQEI
jgi:hypothetical protein